MIDKLKNVITTLTIAISNCLLYSKNHELVEDHAKRLLDAVREATDDKVEIMLIEDDLVVNKIPVRNAGLHGAKLVRRLKRMGVSHLEIEKDIPVPEVKQFITALAAGESLSGRHAHIRVCSVDIHLDEHMDRKIDISDLTDFTEERIQKVKDILYNISPFKMLKVTGIEEIITDFIASFQKEANVLKLLNPVKTRGDYTSTHSTNVAILSMFQAESLGLDGAIIHDIGVSALLHDVGKLFISKEILEKGPPSYIEEAVKMKQHPVYGAAYLVKVEGLTRLAPIVAYEHHMKYDGTGYPSPNSEDRRQHLCSQIVAIADFFDTLRSTRLYQRSWEIKDILTVMKMHAGREFNPFLVDNFARTLLLAIS